jgi:hypothetical protein
MFMEEKIYQPPAIIYEGELEVQAGSPFGGAPEEIDPLAGGGDGG